jgi:hypothetical protein
LNTTTSTESEKNNANTRQKDRFETVIENRKESALFEQKKAECDQAIANLESLSPPMTATGAYLSDRAPINTEAVHEKSQDSQEEKSEAQEMRSQVLAAAQKITNDLRLVNGRIRILG